MAEAMASIAAARASVAVQKSASFFGIGTLKRVPADLNRRDSQMVIDERVFGH
jgi:hypothetical protein